MEYRTKLTDQKETCKIGAPCYSGFGHCQVYKRQLPLGDRDCHCDLRCPEDDLTPVSWKVLCHVDNAGIPAVRKVKATGV